MLILLFVLILSLLSTCFAKEITNKSASALSVWVEMM